MDSFSIVVPKFNVMFSCGFFKCRARTRGNVCKIDTHAGMAGREARIFSTPPCAKVYPVLSGREGWRSKDGKHHL